MAWIVHSPGVCFAISVSPLNIAVRYHDLTPLLYILSRGYTVCFQPMVKIAVNYITILDCLPLCVL